MLNVEGLIYGVKIPHFAVWIIKGFDGNHSLTTVVAGKKKKKGKKKYEIRASNLSFPFFDQGEGKKCAKWKVFGKKKTAIPETTRKNVAGLSGLSYSCILRTFAKDLQIM